MRLIDADIIGLTNFEIIMCNGSYKTALEMILDQIENAPTIDAVLTEDIKKIINDPGYKDDLIRYCLIKELVEEAEHE